MQRIVSMVMAIALLGMLAMSGGAHAATERAIVAGGCFWCVEADFEKVRGVRSVVSGYTGGTSQNPTYQNHEGHYEAVEIIFDNSQISYEQLIGMFLRSVDVTDNGGQFCDRGASYRTAIFVSDAAQKAAAEAAVAEASRSLGTKVVTPVLAASTFWKAEAYHQDYYKSSDIVLTRAGPKQKKNAYSFYRQACGRDARVKQLWGNQAVFAK
ncbi:peptide-methionine (S)-S-oxide reductase MsrA [Pseudorhodobacter sp. MZDSW-24AT]|uniref:peptide-methionine (S)-S-oxide reductase MsrA n=1 Tax=Pseudorhodobacter sp. MZDSW-24AT TaxID=2052957 RepID=UPI000C1E229A|nr:peptide-methionine (S)-S-oxide reductase MsrA [Pseudorhodobacter sp. MZDSW-24AT]PJF09993.1 peptide-methionine (S)-S-oxide reductase [Pseudorhodobacter sp. MZDSW-24AT]